MKYEYIFGLTFCECLEWHSQPVKVSWLTLIKSKATVLTEIRQTNTFEMRKDMSFIHGFSFSQCHDQNDTYCTLALSSRDTFIKTIILKVIFFKNFAYKPINLVFILNVIIKTFNLYIFVAYMISNDTVSHNIKN